MHQAGLQAIEQEDILAMKILFKHIHVSSGDGYLAAAVETRNLKLVAVLLCLVRDLDYDAGLRTAVGQGDVSIAQVILENCDIFDNECYEELIKIAKDDESKYMVELLKKNRDKFA